MATQNRPIIPADVRQYGNIRVRMVVMASKHLDTDQVLVGDLVGVVRRVDGKRAYEAILIDVLGRGYAISLRRIRSIDPYGPNHPPVYQITRDPAPKHVNSWGWIDVGAVRNALPEALAQDELGYLWVNGDVVPCFRIPTETDARPAALVFWTKTGVGLWVHPKSLASLQSISRLDMTPDQWLPVTETPAEPPPFVKQGL